MPCSLAILAAVPRLYALSSLGLNSDEAVYVGQAATLAGTGGMSASFSLFRAHPLLVQFVNSLVFRFTGVDDNTARILAALVFGVGGVLATYYLAKRLYGSRVAIASAALLAIVPYHVLVSRQVLLDAPVTFFATLAFFAAHKWRWTGETQWLAAAGVAAGAATLSKEIGFVIGAVLLVYFLATRALSRKAIRGLLAFLAGFTLLVVPFLASRLIRASNAGATVLWQFGRAPNHNPDYFPRVLAQYVGIPVLLLTLIGFVMMAVRRTDSDWLALSWLVVMGAFFQLWPTKLISYLMLLMPPLAMAAAVGFETVVTVLIDPRQRSGFGRFAHSIGVPGSSRRGAWTRMGIAITSVAAIVFAAPLLWASMALARNGPAQAGKLGDFGVGTPTFAGGREMGEWANKRTPSNAVFMTIGPSLGNIIALYSKRNFVALSVSPDVRKRNPAYVPVPNPDLAMRTSAVDYVVWDAYSSRRSVFTSKRLLRYARSYGAQPVFAVWGKDERNLSTGRVAPKGVTPRILVYVVTGSTPRLTSQTSVTQPGSGP